jgi:D-sedoheptulose 7-phosphate isomerase
VNHIEHLYAQDPSIEGFARRYLDHLAQVAGRIDVTEVSRFVGILLDARDRGARIFFIGNGGSASTASHFGNDLAVGSRSWDKPFRAISLTDNVAVLTAIANDWGYEHVFTLQLKAQLQPGDVVVAISASGNSPNILEAIDYAKAQGATTVGLTGFDGGALRDRAQCAVHVPTGGGEYGPVEDVHLIINHLVGAFELNHCRVVVQETR